MGTWWAARLQLFRRNGAERRFQSQSYWEQGLVPKDCARRVLCGVFVITTAPVDRADTTVARDLGNSPIGALQLPTPTPRGARVRAGAPNARGSHFLVALRLVPWIWPLRR